MSSGNYLFTSESVSEGHPDKVCDQISDAIVDMFLAADPNDARVACETLTTTNLIVLAGEVRGPAEVANDKAAMEQAARDTVKRIGYEQDGFHWQKAEIPLENLETFPIFFSYNFEFLIAAHHRGLFCEVGPAIYPRADRSRYG